MSIQYFTKALLPVLFVLLTVSGMAQQASNKMPPFRLVLADGRFFSAENLQKNKPSILIYFSPDCDHCKVLMHDFFKRVNEFSRAEIVMITFRPLKEVEQFIDAYKINTYPNIKVGTETSTYFIRYYYNLTNTPFTALFNKRGELIYAYRKETSVADLISRLKAIK